MKITKKIVAVLSVVIFTVMLAGCGTLSPKRVVDKRLKSIQKLKKENITEILGSKNNKDSKGSEFIDKYKESSVKLVQTVNKITYKINSETIDGDNAKVNVTIKGPDLENMLTKFIEKMLSEALSMQILGKNMTTSEKNEKFDEVFAEVIGEAKFKERTMDINLIKNGKQWEIKDNDELTKLVLNFDSSSIDKLENSIKSKRRSGLSSSYGNSNGNSTFSNDYSQTPMTEISLKKPFAVITKYGVYNLTLDGVRTTEERNKFSKKNVKKVIYFDYTYENKSYDMSGRDLYVGSSAFQIMDDEGNILDTYPISDTNRHMKGIPVGGKCQASQAYGITTDSKNIKVIVKNNGQKVGKITIPLN